MRFTSWFGKLLNRLSSCVVQDVPAGLDGCEMCRETGCTQGRWESCERRIAAEAAHVCDERVEAAILALSASGPVVPADVARTPKPASS